MIAKLLAPLALVLALGLPASTTAQEFSSLEERMSAAEFKAAGLDKLSAEELARLNAWLRNKSSSLGSGAAGYDPRGLRAPGGDRPIGSRIVGEFRGWSGPGTRIELDNGQVWETVDGSSLVVKLDNPRVSITPGSFGSWFLKVDGYNTSAKVKRIR